MFKKFLPRENRFFTLFNTHSKLVSQGLDQFIGLAQGTSDPRQAIKTLKNIENQADDVAHQIFELLNTVFVTPFDREDIQALTHHVDDIIDMVERAGTRMVIYQIDTPPETIIRQADILKKAFNELSAAIHLLSDLKEKEKIRQICIRVNSLENEGDTELLQALTALFSHSKFDDPVSLIKKKEIFELLESAINRCEDLANVIETILIKYA